MNYLARAKRVTASLPRDLALAIMEKIQEARGTMWTERVRGPKAGIDTQQNMMERAQVWVWHEEPGRRQPAAPPQPPPATKLMQADFTRRDVGTWATENKGGMMIGQPYQQKQCAGNPCSTRAHVVPWWFVIAAILAA